MRFLCVALACIFWAQPAGAFVRTLADSGAPLFWANPVLHVQGNPRNASGLSDQEVYNLLAPAFSAWSVPGSRASAHYSQHAGAPTNSNFDGINAAYFSSASGRAIGYGVVAVTEVLYYVSSGQIVEADIVFNDDQFRFTANEGDTGKNINGKPAIFLQDVATHEAGHAFGLDHSTVNLSSLVYTAFSGQFVPSNDDKNGIRTAYPSGGSRAVLTGTVLGTRGGIFGAHVAAINLETGQVEAGSLTQPDGSFRLGDLQPGSYAVLMEPLGANIGSISRYYQNVDHRFCPSSQMFRRRFYGPCGSSTASVVNVSHGQSISLGTLSPSCSQMGTPGAAPVSIASAAPISAGGGAKFGTLRPGDTHYYRVSQATGRLVARALSYSLYSPVNVEVDFLALNGSPLPGATSVKDVQDPMPGGFVNYDSMAEALGSGGDYIIRVSADSRRIYSPAFPAGFDLLDGDGHYLLSLSLDGSHGPTSLADMSACVTVNNRIQNASFRAPASSKRDDKNSGGGCGSLGSGGSPWNGSVTQIVLVAFFCQLVLLLTRRERALVRKDR